MNKYKYSIIFQNCCSTKKIFETKAEFLSGEEAKKEADLFLKQNYPEVDRYHFKIIVEKADN